MRLAFISKHARNELEFFLDKFNIAESLESESFF